MSGHSIGTTLLAAGLLAALAAPGSPSLGPGSRGAAPADTLPPAWMAQVTMEPIRVVVPRESALDAVTMEPIRVVVPRESALDAVTMEPIRVVIPRQDAGARGPGEESPR